MIVKLKLEGGSSLGALLVGLTSLHEQAYQ